jgi:hypothetical protein
MTDNEQRTQYIEQLKEQNGQQLQGVEAMLWKVVNETAGTLKSGRDKLAMLRRQVAETEQALLQVTGRHQGALDMLWQAEAERRAAGDPGPPNLRSKE